MKRKEIWFALTPVVLVCMLLASGGLVGAGKNHVGLLTREQLFKDYPSWAQRAQQYAPRGEIVQKLQNAGEPVEILLFLGTWCPTSVMEVPRFLKVYELAGNPSFSMKMYGVDEKIRDGAGLSEKYRVQRVPTLIFFRNGNEIGRVVEYPRRSIEEDFWEIIESRS